MSVKRTQQFVRQPQQTSSAPARGSTSSRSGRAPALQWDRPRGAIAHPKLGTLGVPVAIPRHDSCALTIGGARNPLAKKRVQQGRTCPYSADRTPPRAEDRSTSPSRDRPPSLPAPEGQTAALRPCRGPPRTTAVSVTDSATRAVSSRDGGILQAPPPNTVAFPPRIQNPAGRPRPGPAKTKR